MHVCMWLCVAAIVVVPCVARLVTWHSLLHTLGTSSYYSDLTNRETESRLNVLAVVLGFLGLAELVINIVQSEGE